VRSAEGRPLNAPAPAAAGTPQPVRAVLFDLDGTLVDSAPDLAGAANRLRAQHGLEPLPLATLRPMVGAGARGMVGVAFGCGPDDIGYEPLRKGFLALYEQHLTEQTHAFDGVETLLSALEARRLPWGIVTNKAERFTLPIVRHLRLAPRAAVLICGDTTPHAKPHPEPLLEAARRLGLPPRQVLYVGDDHRDAQAAQAAGMPMLAAAWGYLGQGTPIEGWGADARIDAPNGVLDWLDGR